jgi:hypothetical protein
MSMGAKDELIKSVAQAIPTHVMSIFKLPTGFHEDYMKLVRNFWWGEDEEKRKVHWAAWTSSRALRIWEESGSEIKS